MLLIYFLENVVFSCYYSTPNNDCTLSLALKNIINLESNIIFINNLIPLEYTPNYFYNAIKFTNLFRNMVLELNQNLENNNEENKFYIK